MVRRRGRERLARERGEREDVAWRKKGGGNPRWVRKASREMVPTTRIYPNAASTVASSALDMDMLRDSNTFNALIAKDERLKGENNARARGMMERTSHAS